MDRVTQPNVSGVTDGLAWMMAGYSNHEGPMVSVGVNIGQRLRHTGPDVTTGATLPRVTESPPGDFSRPRPCITIDPGLGISERMVMSGVNIGHPVSYCQ